MVNGYAGILPAATSLQADACAPIHPLRLLSIYYSPFTIYGLMKVLMIGDVVGKPGRTALLDRLQDLKEQHAIDFTVMNAENVAGGFSITPAIAELLFSSGIDVMTSGN